MIHKTLVSAYYVRPQDVNTNQKDIHKTWEVKTDNSQVKSILVRTFEGNICLIHVELKNTTEQNFKAVKKRFEDQYGASEGHSTTTGWQYFIFRPKIDGKRIAISSLFTPDSSFIIMFKYDSIDVAIPNDSTAEKKDAVMM